MIIRFDEMILKKNFGTLRPGASREEIRMVIGEPEDWIITRKGKTKDRSKLWRYGSIEFAFHGEGGVDGDQLDAIFIRFYDPVLKLPPGVTFEGYFPSRTTTAEALGHYLTEHQIFYEEYPTLTGDEQLGWIIGKGAAVYHAVSIIFSIGEDKIPFLNKISINL